MAETEVLTGKKGRKAAIKAAQAAEKAPQPERSAKFKGKPKTDNVPTFWEKLKGIANADWGPRANIYLYRVEPITDRTRGGGAQVYIMKYPEPISEDRILADHGSGRYKAMLTFRKPGAEQGDEVDSIYLELLNLQFPPKIPPGEWVDDPRNKKWAWAKQHFQQEQQQSGNLDPIKMMDSYDRMRKNWSEENPKIEPEDRLNALAGVFAKILPKQSAPDEQMKNLAMALTALKPADTTTALLQAQIAAADKRADDFMKMFMEGMKKDNSGGGIKGVVEAVKELEPLIEKFFPAVKNAAGEVLGGRSRMNGWQEFVMGIAPTVGDFLKPVTMTIAEVIATRAMQGNPAAGRMPVITQPPAALPPGQQQAPPSANNGSMMGFVGMIANALINWARPLGPPANINPAELGDDFASWVHEGYGADPRYAEAIATLQAGGSSAIITMLRPTPFWTNKGPQNNLPSLAELEPKLPAFFDAFLKWKPEAEQTESEEDEPDESIGPEIVDFEKEMANAG